MDVGRTCEIRRFNKIVRVTPIVVHVRDPQELINSSSGCRCSTADSQNCENKQRLELPLSTATYMEDGAVLEP